MLSFKINKTQSMIFLFFFAYFITYIGEMTNLKYIVVAMFQLWLLMHYKKFEIGKLDKIILYMLVFIFVCLLVSLLFNFNLGGAVKTLSLIDLFIISFFFLSRGLTNLKINPNKLIEIITGSLFLVLAVACIFRFNDTVIATGRSTGTIVRHRFGTGAESIVGFLCFVEFTLSFYLIYVRKKQKKSIVFLLLQCTLSLYMAYLASIRTSMFSMIFFIVMFFYNKLPRNRTTIIIKFIIFLMSLTSIVIFTASVPLDMNTLNYVLSSRFVYYERAITEVINNDAVMVGLGSFRNSSVVEMNRVQVDNSYLDVFYQYGLLCLIPLCSLLLVIANRLNRITSSIDRKVNSIDYNNFINAYFITILLYSMGEKNLFSLSSALSLVSFILLFNYIECHQKIINII